MSAITLNGTLLRRLIKVRFPGGVDELQSLWNKDGGVHRTTVFRWTKGHLPQDSEDLLHIAELLDIDPFALLAFSSDDLDSAIDRLIESFQRGRWKPALSFLKDFFGRQRHWPPESFAERYAWKRWYISEFSHDPHVSSNVYALVRLLGQRQYDEHYPQLFHFAFRCPKRHGSRWLQYGFVSRLGSSVSLVHIDGHTHSYRVKSQAEPSCVETFFGPEAATFRVASLHDFLLSFDPENINHRDAVRFRG
ncbi:MAG: hypothetical protein GEV05_25125 [Betaproteobacteria bacterium]|nr:hypothetical protein [Betaproteobacteria bacterium]